MSFLKLATKVFAVSSFVSLMSSSNVFAAAFGVVSGNNVNIRSEASSSSEILGNVPQGTEFNVLGKEGDWYSIMYDFNQGYISSEFFVVNKVEANVIENNVNIRNSADINGSVVGSANKGQEVIVVAQNDDWYKLNDNSFINKSYIDGSLLELVTTDIGNVVVQASNNNVSGQNTYGIVTTTSGLNLRSEASIESKSLGVLPYGEIVDVINISNNWIKVKTVDGDEGYVSAEYCSVRAGEKPSRGNSSSKGEQIVNYAKQFLGTPYVYGGTNLNSGVDCSGFIYSVYKYFGISLNRSSTAMASNGVPIDKSQLQVGDLVFFDTTGINDGGISHVGIYMGNGKYIHASSGKEYCVTISDLNNSYAKSTYVTSRRVLR